MATILVSGKYLTIQECERVRGKIEELIKRETGENVNTGVSKEYMELIQPRFGDDIISVIRRDPVTGMNRREETRV
jgi:hypothetical protein